MDDQTTNKPQDDTQAGSPAPSTVTRGPRGNILPDRSAKGVDPSLDITESGVVFPHNLRNHDYTYRRTRNGVTLDGHVTGDPSQKLDTLQYSASAKWSLTKQSSAADGSRVLSVLGLQPIKGDRAWADFMRGEENDGVVIDFVADFEAVENAPSSPTQQSSNNPSARPHLNVRHLKRSRTFLPPELSK
jgi:hypothetical protein